MTGSHEWLAATRDELAHGTFVGRVFDPSVGGPSPMLITDDGVFDLSARVSTMSAITENEQPARAARDAIGASICTVDELVDNSWRGGRDMTRPWLLCPFDLHVIKAAGVTFATSMIERVIEERALGDKSAAHALRQTIAERLGGSLHDIRPGSTEAEHVKRILTDEGVWSQYLEVGIGADAEIFTKAPVLSSVGYGDEVGVAEISDWNNPEPEMVIAVSSRGRAVGATLGNDVNLRDVEGRSALLLPRAKDNNASSAIGPWIRLFDDTYSLADVSSATITMTVHGAEGFELDSEARLEEMSRSIPELIDQLVGRHHAYPDGAALYLGTPFAPVADRGSVPGAGFTHLVGDIVMIETLRIGALINRVNTSEECPPWSEGIAALMRNLAQRGLLAETRDEVAG